MQKYEGTTRLPVRGELNERSFGGGNGERGIRCFGRLGTGTNLLSVRFFEIHV